MRYTKYIADQIILYFLERALPACARRQAVILRPFLECTRKKGARPRKEATMLYQIGRTARFLKIGSIFDRYILQKCIMCFNYHNNNLRS